MGTMAKIDDSVKKKVPELRFKGFTDDWEERKLGELSNIVGGGTPSTSNSEYWDGDIDWYAPAEIGEQRYVSKSKKTITELGLKKSSARILPVGTVLFTSRAGIGNTAILGKEATTNQGFQSIVPNPNKLDSYFIYSRTNELKRYGEVTGAGSTFVEVSGKQMSKMSIMIPELSEQKKIGSFFEQLDNTIALHQRKLDLLKEQKKGYLQKMFPKNGAKVPELRFAGFADDWEQRKLSDIVVRLNKSSNNNQLPKVEFEDIIAGEGRLNKDISRKFDDRKGTLFEPDNILYGKLRPYLKNWLFSDFKGIALGDFWVFKSINSEPKFVYSLIQSDNYQRVANDTSGTKMPRSDWKKVSSSNFSIPTSLEEQQKIGSFFKQLDDTISLHQRKLDLLKEQKKGFLQKMFL